MHSVTFYEVWIKSPDLAFSASINDISLHVERFQESSEWAQTVNQWVLPGHNAFRVLLHAGPRQHEGLDAGIAVHCEFREIVIVGESRTVSVLASSSWVYEEGMAWPQSLELMVDLGPPFHADWAWIRADRIDEVNLRDSSLVRMVEALNTALANKDMENLKGLLEVKARELASAYQIPLEERLRDQEAFFLDFFSDSKWTMRPIEWVGIIHELHADGRLLELMSRDGKPLLASGDLAGDGNFRLGLYLYRVNQEWYLAR